MGKFAALAERIGRTFAPGEVLFSQGDAGDCMFLIHSGSVEVAREDRGSRTVLASLGPGELVGEMAMLDRRPRSATVTATTETRAIPLTREFLQQNAHRDAAFLFQILETLSLRLERTGDMLLKAMASAGHAPPPPPPGGVDKPDPLVFLRIFRGFAQPDRYLNLRSDQAVYSQGEFGELMYIVLDGTVAIMIESAGETCFLEELGRGDFFGEASLLSGGARSSTARAITPVTLLPVDRDALVRGVGQDPAAALYLIQVLIMRLRQGLAALGSVA